MPPSAATNARGKAAASSAVVVVDVFPPHPAAARVVACLMWVRTAVVVPLKDRGPHGSAPAPFKSFVCGAGVYVASPVCRAPAPPSFVWAPTTGRVEAR